MKKALLLVVSVICMVASFWVGRETANSDLKANADGILAYQHYYECAEGILKDVNVTDTALAKECDLARKELKDYLDGHGRDSVQAPSKHDSKQHGQAVFGQCEF